MATSRRTRQLWPVTRDRGGDLAVIFPGDGHREFLRLSDDLPIHAGLVDSPEATIADWDMHYPVELGVVLSGRMRRLWRTWETELRPGEVWLCGIWERHGWEVVEGPCQHLVLVVLPEVLMAPGLPAADRRDWLAPFRPAPPRRPRVSESQRHEVLALARQAVGKLALHTPARGVWLRLMVLELLLLVQRDWERPARLAPAPADSLQALASAIELVLGSRRIVSTAEAAAACRMSQTAFRRRFRDLMGITFAKFALRHRLSQAAALLLRTDHPLKAVAADCGFTDDSHLHRAFLRHYGRSPGEYRRRRRLPSEARPGRSHTSGRPRRSR